MCESLHREQKKKYFGKIPVKKCASAAVELNLSIFRNAICISTNFLPQRGLKLFGFDYKFLKVDFILKMFEVGICKTIFSFKVWTF